MYEEDSKQTWLFTVTRSKANSPNDSRQTTYGWSQGEIFNNHQVDGTSRKGPSPLCPDSKACHAPRVSRPSLVPKQLSEAPMGCHSGYHTSRCCVPQTDHAQQTQVKEPRVQGQGGPGGGSGATPGRVGVAGGCVHIASIQGPMWEAGDQVRPSLL